MLQHEVDDMLHHSYSLAKKLIFGLRSSHILKVGCVIVVCIKINRTGDIECEERLSDKVIRLNPRV